MIRRLAVLLSPQHAPDERRNRSYAQVAARPTADQAQSMRSTRSRSDLIPTGPPTVADFEALMSQYDLAIAQRDRLRGRLNLAINQGTNVADAATASQAKVKQLESEAKQLMYEIEALGLEVWQTRKALGFVSEQRTRVERELHRAQEANGDLLRSQSVLVEQNHELRRDLLDSTSRIAILQTHITKAQRTDASAIDESDFASDDEIRRQFHSVFEQAQKFSLRMMDDVAAGRVNFDPGTLYYLEDFMPYACDPGSFTGGTDKYILNTLVHLIVNRIAQKDWRSCALRQDVNAPAELTMCLERKAHGAMPYGHFHRWRIATKDLLRAIVPGYFDASRAAFAEKEAHVVAAEIESAIGSLLAPAKLAGLKKIFTAIFDFLLMLQFHPAGYVITLAPVSDLHGGTLPFDPEMHEDIGGIAVGRGNKTFLCGSIFPALHKEHNESGEMHELTLVSKSKVLRFIPKGQADVPEEWAMNGNVGLDSQMTDTGVSELDL